jgi:hypothetical protein
VYPCWEATTEPVYKNDVGQFVVHPRHLLQSGEGTPKLLKSAEVGFALAEYSHGDDVDPVRLHYADQCHSKFLLREARQAAAPARKRPQPAFVQATLPVAASSRKRSQHATAKASPLAPATRNLRSKRN